jgi:ATP-dependent Zn protease
MALTIEKIYNIGYREHGDVLLVVSPGTGNVTVAYELAENTWVVVDTVSTSTFKLYPVRGNRIRFTPSGNASYIVYGAA